MAVIAPNFTITQTHADVTRDVIATLERPNRGYYFALFGAVGLFIIGLITFGVLLHDGLGHAGVAGASLGGLASAKLAIEANASGLIIFASPVEIARWDFTIEAEDLNIDTPKLFMTAEQDSVVPLASSQGLYDLAADPKEWQTYPGTAHGTDLFEEDYGEEAARRILEFLLSVNANS